MGFGRCQAGRGVDAQGFQHRLGRERMGFGKVRFAGIDVKFHGR